MTPFYLVRLACVSTLMMGAALTGCQRAAFSFQPGQVVSMRVSEESAAAFAPSKPMPPVPAALAAGRGRARTPRHGLAAVPPQQQLQPKPSQRLGTPRMRSQAAAVTNVPQQARPEHRPWAERKAPPRATNSAPRRSKGIALVLALLLGVLGAHQFYLGYIGRGLLYLGISAAVALFAALALLSLAFGGAAAVFFTVAVLLATLLQYWIITDILRVLMGNLMPKNGQYSDKFF
ncbi:NINE protein [Hymenobacter sp. BT523]|uniref:NINE protein n=1 Tax=Hymenobacter sp. BT523 TaxID=2795725 RepID=UPI0018EA7B7F|nr:NINE protein [Hymenobacter sp. BT523]MBJ6111524.1 NINE protein [Hymenobacter sp. BT523]